MRSRGSLKGDADANAAGREALRGVAVGAARWSVPSILLSALGQIFMVMSGMIMGGWIEGDRRLRRYEEWMRAQRQIAQKEASLRDFELEEERARMRARERLENATRGSEEGKQWGPEGREGGNTDG